MVSDAQAARVTLRDTLRTGWIVITILAILTMIEFIFAVTLDDAWQIATLAVIGVLKAAAIIQKFMHFSQLWQHIAEVWGNILYESVEEE